MAKVLKTTWVLFLLMGCGGPSGVNPTDLTSLTPAQIKNACSPGAGGADNDKDGIADTCQQALGLPANDPDCDKDGIPNSRDNPKDCTPGVDPNSCDEYCQENRRRQNQEMMNSMALGGSAVGGQTYPGINVLIKKKVFAFANRNGVLDIDGAIATVQGANQRLTNSLCNPSDGKFKSQFYLYTFGDVTFQSFKIGNEIVPAMSKTNINFEICGEIAGFDPSNISTLNTPVEGQLKVTMFGATEGAYPINALVDPNKQTSSKLTLTPTEEEAIRNPLPSACSSVDVTGMHLFERMKAQFETISSEALNQLVLSGADGKTADMGGTFASDKIEEKWKRTMFNFDCSRITSLAFGASGFWVKD